MSNQLTLFSSPPAPKQRTTPMWNPRSYAVRGAAGEVLASCGSELDSFHVSQHLRPGVPDYDSVTCESTAPDPRRQVRLDGYVLWHGIACHPDSDYSWQCAVAFVVGVFLLRGRPAFSTRRAHREGAAFKRR